MTGISSHPLYEVWRTAMKRCGQSPEGKSYKDYPHYGARGIRVCPEWAESYESFYNWAMSHGYRRGLTLDRVCNYRGYSPGNCRWISRKAQAYNRRTNHLLTARGETHTIKQWAEIRGMAPTTISDRIRHGWSPEDAVFTEVRGRRH